jgi:hypothetical protein
MALVIDAFPVFNEQNLRRFVPNIKYFGQLITDSPVVDQVEEIKVDIGRRVALFQSGFHHAADSTANRMFKDYLRFDF